MTPFDDHLTIKIQTKKRNGLKISGVPSQKNSTSWTLFKLALGLIILCFIYCCSKVNGSFIQMLFPGY